MLRPDPEDDFENEDLEDVIDQETPLTELEYGKIPEWAKTRPIRKDESIKHSKPQ